MRDNTKKGILFAILTAAISGVSIFYNKQVIVSGIDSLIFNIFKNGGVAVILTLLLLSVKKLPSIAGYSKKQWLKLGLIGFVGGSIPFILYFDALRSVPAVNANIIHKSLFIWVALLAVPTLGEKLTIWQIVGYILVAYSNLVIGGFTGFTWSRAEFMILTATILWSLENIIAKIVLKNMESTLVAWARMFLGTLILIAVAIFQSKTNLLVQIKPDQILATSGSIILLSGYVISWYQALKLAPATLVTSILILATPITNILSAVFITHALPNQQIINLFGTVAGLIFITRMTHLAQRNTQPAAT